MTKGEWKNLAETLQEKTSFLEAENKRLKEDLDLFKEYILLGNYLLTVIKKGKK